MHAYVQTYVMRVFMLFEYAKAMNHQRLLSCFFKMLFTRIICQNNTKLHKIKHELNDSITE